MRINILLLCACLAVNAASPVDSIVPAGKPTVSDAIFARRVYLDTWGLLPTPEQLADFTQSKDPQKREHLVDALLANKSNYAEHWMTFWNDHLRNDEGVALLAPPRTV